ncbi:MAG: GH3 auxin-responsive promoter family protein [Saprospiraceae bacterium]
MPLLGNLIKTGSQIGQRIESNASPIEAQTKCLSRLLNKAKNTAFGHAYGFRNILNTSDFISEFQSQVPVFDYEKINREWWHRARNNESDVAWKGKIKYFALSSGTSCSASKQIPVSKEMINEIRRVGMKIFFSLPKFELNPETYSKNMFLLGGCTDLKYQDGYFLGDLSGINTGQLPFWMRSTYRPGRAIANISAWEERIDAIAKHAKQWDVGFLTGIPAWAQLMVERIIDYHKVDTIHDIWPNLKVFVHGGVAFDPYRKGFEKLIREPLIYLDTYLASEGFIAFQNRPNTRSMTMVLNNGIFYEFVPFNEQNFTSEGEIIGNPKGYTIDQVEKGVDYALLMSTCAGAWRYLIGDTVRFTDTKKGEIIITGRTKHFLNVCAEHLSVDNMNQAIQKVEEKLNIAIPEFTVCGLKIDNYFVHKWYIGCQTMIPTEQIISLLDQELILLNDDYKFEREGILKELQLEVIPPKQFYNYQAHQGKMGGQNKFPRVMRESQFREWERFLGNSIRELA